MGTLEKIVSGSPMLERICREKIIKESQYDRRDVTIKYLQKTAVILEKAGVDSEGFLGEFCDVFGVPYSIESDMMSPNRWVNRWVYRGYMESARLVLGYSSDDFYRQVFEETFSDVRDTILSAADFFDLGFILKNMNRQNHQWNNLTEISYDKKLSGRGKIVLLRRTIDEHRDEIEKLFGEEVSKEVLKDDCIATRAAYETVFKIMGDPRAGILNHDKCEAEGGGECRYVIEFTPIPLFTTVQRGIIYVLAKIIPELGGMLGKYKEIKERNFRLQDEIEQEVRHSRELYRMLEEVADASRRSARHEVVGYERQRNFLFREFLADRAVEHFLRMKNRARCDEEVQELCDILAEEMFLNSLSGREEVARDVLKGEVGEIISPFVDEEQRYEQTRREVERYGKICNDFVERMNDSDGAKREFLRMNPFHIEEYYAGLDISKKVIGAFEEQAEQIRDTMNGIRLPLEQIVMTAQKQAIDARGKDLQADYNLERDIEVPKPLIFVKVVRDLFYNVIDYGGGRAEIYAGGVPSGRAKEMREIAGESVQFREYLRIRDYGMGIGDEKINATNDFLAGRSSEISTSQNEDGNSGTRDLRNYLKSVEMERRVYCKYGAGKGGGTSVEFFFE